MTTTSSRQVYAHLVNLAAQAGANIYERLKAADTLLSDKEWVRTEDCGGGDESVAIDRLEANCFADLCGALSLPQMLEIYHQVPDFTIWQREKFNLTRMHALLVESRRAERASRARPTSHRGEAGSPTSEGGQGNVRTNQEIVAELRAENSRLSDRLKAADRRIAQLEKENGKLRTMINRINARLRQLTELAAPAEEVA